MKALILLFLAILMCSPVTAGDFASLLGKGPAAADAWLGKATVLANGMRDYDRAGYGFTLTYAGEKLTKITLGYFPAGKAPRTPQDVARMISPDLKVGAVNKRGILEHCFCSDSQGVWEMLLTPGDDGYSIVNITPPP